LLTDKSISTIPKKQNNGTSTFYSQEDLNFLVFASLRLEGYPQYSVVPRNLIARFVLIALCTKRPEEASYFNSTDLSPIPK
jgi:hypothetical protein